MATAAKADDLLHACLFGPASPPSQQQPVLMMTVPVEDPSSPCCMLPSSPCVLLSDDLAADTCVQSTAGLSLGFCAPPRQAPSQRYSEQHYSLDEAFYNSGVAAGVLLDSLISGEEEDEAGPLPPVSELPMVKCNSELGRRISASIDIKWGGG
jgi:hypothetical protein